MMPHAVVLFDRDCAVLREMDVRFHEFQPCAIQADHSLVVRSFRRLATDHVLHLGRQLVSYTGIDSELGVIGESGSEQLELDAYDRG